VSEYNLGAILKSLIYSTTKPDDELEIRYYHCNHLGTPLALTNTQGEIVWQAQHDAWGNITKEYNPYGIRQDIRLPGQHQDRQTGLYYNRHRYYDPKLGSYINQDPVGLSSGEPNLFAYVNNPIHWIDPLGLQAVAGNAQPTQNCIYQQSTGNLTCTANGNQTINYNGYAGRDVPGGVQGRNNPTAQNVSNVGPIPAGNYTIGPSFQHRRAGVATRRLTPDANNNMQGRSGFLIHGNNAENDASEGCIIMPRAIRDTLNNGDRLEVIP
jgi:RHS repeat-associated protein